MQADNYNYKPDKQFTDESWKAMRKVLDKEMPVENKRRKGIFWIFFMLGIGVVSALWFFSQEKNTPEENNVQMTSRPQNVKTIPTLPSEKLNKEPKEENSNSTIANLKITNEKKSTLSNSNTNQTFGKSVPLKKYSKQPEDFIPSTPNKVDDNIDFPSTNNSEIKTIAPAKVKSVDKPIAIEPIAFLFENFYSPTNINLEEIEKWYVSEDDFEEEEVINKVVDKRKIEGGVFVGGVMDFSNPRELGITSGVGVHFPIGEKLGIRTGVNYSSLKKNLPFHFSGQQSAMLNDNFADIDPTVSSVAIQSSTDFILNELGYLEVPILLTHSSNPKLRLEIGAQGSYLIRDVLNSTNNDFSIIQPDPSGLPAGINNYSESTLDLRSISFRQYDEESYWNRLDVSGVVGLTWKPIHRLNIRLQYNRGLTKYFETNDSGVRIVANEFDNYQVYSESNSADAILNSGFQKKKNINQSLRLTVGFNLFN